MDAGLRTVLEPVFWSGVAPAAVVFAAVALRRLAPVRWREHRWPLTLALASGYVVAKVGSSGWPSWPPREVLHWLPWAAVVAVVLGVVDELRPWPRLVRLGSHALLFGALGFLVVRPVARSWNTPLTVLVVVGLAVAAVLAWRGVDDTGDEDRRVPFALMALLATATGGSAVAVISASARLGQLFGGVAAAWGTLTVLALFRVNIRVDRGPAVVGTLLLLGLLTVGQLYSRTPWPCTLLLGVAATSAWLGKLPLLGVLLGKKKRWLVAGAAAFLPALAAIIVALVLAEPSTGYY